MNTKTLTLMLALMFALPRGAAAVCGDVNGDLKKTSADALLVLRSAVGQTVDLNCIDTTPSRVRFYSEIDCTSGSDTSVAHFDDSDESYQFQANPNQTTAYKTVDDT